MDYPSMTERNYLAAKARLEAAQIEKLEAATELLAARAALHQTLETFWPGDGECARDSGYDKATYGEYEIRQCCPCAVH